MEIIHNTIKQILLENRVDNVRKKFPNVNPEFIDYFVRHDPSGNQKYLEWLVKAISHTPTVGTINHQLLGININSDEPTIETVNELWFLVNQFHNLLPYMVYINDDGKKEGTKDLYQYKFTDSEMINYLTFDINQAEERRITKEQEKISKKGADKIYEDSNWLVVRPKTYESSCVYGAGTKWCTTSKETPSHFIRETDRNFLIYVTNKKEDKSNPLYKVAWQIPYTKNIDKIMLSAGTVKPGYLKLWDAEDNNIDGYSTGIRYVNNVPNEVKTSIVNYIKSEMDVLYKNLGYVDNPRIQALVEYLQISQEQSELIVETGESSYGVPTLKYKSVWYGVLNDDELESIKNEWAINWLDDYGEDAALKFIGGNIGDYIYIYNHNALATELVNSYISDLDNQDIVNISKDYGVSEEEIENYNVILSMKDVFDDDISELESNYGLEKITKNEYEQKLHKILNDKIEYKNYIDETLQRIKNRVINRLYIQYIEEMEDPVTWLKNYGWWEDGEPHRDAFIRGIIKIDEGELVRALVDRVNPSFLSINGMYSTININDTNYYIFPTDEE